MASERNGGEEATSTKNDAQDGGVPYVRTGGQCAIRVVIELRSRS